MTKWMQRHKRLIAIFLFTISASAEEPAPPPYRLVAAFPQMPPDSPLVACSAVATNSKGDVLVFRRFDPPVLVFKPSGEFVRSFGKGLFKSPHGLRVDRDDNVWVTDNADHTVMKFDHAGRLLLTLGEKGVAGDDEKHFNKPTDIAFADNGDVFVSDGYGNSRVAKFDREGKFLLTWGRKGKGEGEFNLPHAIRLDSKGNVYVADRENRRIQVFGQDGRFIRQFGEMSPYGLFMTPEDVLFVADGVANRILKMSSDGKVLAAWGTTGIKPGDFKMPHGVTVAVDGAVYVTEIDGKRVQKFEPAR